MLGNWSFGDYFKVFHVQIRKVTPPFLRQAIAYCWELFNVFQLPKDRLYVTYFEGDSANSLDPDLEAKQLWLDRGFAEDNILPGNAKDNFWGTRFCAVQNIRI